MEMHPTPTSPAALEERCARAGLKMTQPRRVILRVLATATDHPSVETLHERVRVIDPTISMATVYRTINLLDQLDIVQRHDFGDNSARFEINEDHHHHLIDVETGEVIEFQNDDIEILKIKIAEALGYDLVDHRLELYGRKRRRS